MNAVMTLPPTTPTSESLFITIDKVRGLVSAVKSDGQKVTVIFHANEDCVVHFMNADVFGREYLPLKRDVLREQTVLAGNETTAFEVLVPLNVGTDRRPWPIIP